MKMPRASQEHWSIRSSFRPGDIGWITYLHGTLYAKEYGWDHTFDAYVAEALAKFALSFDARKDCLWIAEKDEEIVGFVAIAGYSELEAQLRWFLVHPAHRGRGLGRLLLSKALEFCREHKFKFVFLWTVSGLTVAAHLYRSVGFHKTEQKTHHIWGKTLTEERYDLSL
jgi:ribosomal protein S18 acetylase RimI-like enzyme